MKKSFVLYTDIKEKTEDLTDEQFGQLMRAVFNYENGEEPQFQDNFVRFAFKFIKPSLDENAKKYEEKVKNCRRAGRISAQNRTSNNENSDKEVQQKSTDVDNCQQEITVVRKSKRERTDNDISEHTSANVNKRQQKSTDVNISQQTLTVTATATATDTATATVVTSKNARNIYIAPVIEQVVDEFNARCKDLNPVKDITPRRRKAISKLLDQYPIETICDAFDRVSESEYLRGKQPGGFPAQFDWIIDPDNMQRILEGGYGCNVTAKSQVAKDGSLKRSYDFSKLEEEAFGG